MTYALIFFPDPPIFWTGHLTNLGHLITLDPDQAVPFLSPESALFQPQNRTR